MIATFSDIHWEKYDQSEDRKYRTKFENVNENVINKTELTIGKGVHAD